MLIDGWRDPKSGKWNRKEWIDFYPDPEDVDQISIIGPEIPGMDEEERLFSWGDIPTIREKARPGMWLYSMWRRFGISFFLVGWPDHSRDVIPQIILERISTIDAILGGNHGR